MKTDETEKFSPDDPRLTAYALGELEGAGRSAVEGGLRDDAALRAAVAEIRTTAAQLEGALAGEPLPAAPELNVGAGSSRAKRGSVMLKFPQLYYVIPGLAAACFLAFVLVNDPGEAPAPAKVAEQRVRTVIDLPPLEGDVRRDSLAETKAEGSSEVPVVPAGRSALLDRDFIAGPKSASPSAVPMVLPSKVGAMTPDANGSPIVRLQAFEVKDSPDAAFSATTISASPVQALDLLGNPIRRGFVAAAAELSSPATESYAYRKDNGFLSALENPLSTFSADVDTASYSNVRRMLRAGQKPPADAVRIEELVNYFPYRYEAPKRETFAAALEVADAPWAAGHRLVRIGLKAREVTSAERGAANLVFLVDVSGSMNAPERLPLVKESLRLLVNRLRSDDRVAIVTYAGAAGLALASTPVGQTREVVAAIEAMTPGGSTHGSLGIQLAYDIAKANFVTGGVNRVILCTDGDFNVGVTGDGALVRLVQEKAKTGVFLTVLGYGMGNLKDSMLEAIADKGNGSYGYIDSRREAEKLLGAQVNGTLSTVAKDVKLQVEFNPARVASYRLIGYENRLLAKEDFNNDKVDAGEVGAGHSVTALYEVVPTSEAGGGRREAGGGVIAAVDALKYSRPPARVALAEGSAELLTLKVRFKEPAGEESRKLEFVLTDRGATWAEASADFKFAGAVAAFGMVLRDSPHKGTATLADARTWAEAGAADDPGGWRGEFAELARAAAVLE